MFFRFSTFYGESIFEPLLVFKVKFNIFENEKHYIGLSCFNFTDFYAGNLMALSLGINYIINVSSQISVINNLELKHSGGDGLSGTFYGINWQGGVKYSW